MFNVELEKGYKPNARTISLIECVDFWNQRGWGEYNEVKPTIQLGYKEVPESFESFMFNSLLNDCKTFLSEPENNGKNSIPYPKGIKFKFGKSGNHIWVHENNKRVLIVTYGK